MNSPASGSHRTGHPRWVQLTVNATNVPSGSRRSQAAVRATTPAQGSGEESGKSTFTVIPGRKLSTAPTGRHT